MALSQVLMDSIVKNGFRFLKIVFTKENGRLKKNMGVE